MLIDLSLKPANRPSRRFRPAVEALEERAVPALFVTKTIDQPVVTVGETVTYTITVTNTGPDILTSVSASDNLPPGLTPISGSAPLGLNIIGRNIFGDIGFLDIGMSAVVTVHARADLVGTFVNFATATGYGIAFEAAFATPASVQVLENFNPPVTETPPPDTNTDTGSTPPPTDTTPSTTTPQTFETTQPTAETSDGSRIRQRDGNRQNQKGRRTVRRHARARARSFDFPKLFRSPSIIVSRD